MSKSLILFLGSCLLADDRLQKFDGDWTVDMAAEERSSDTGPFFDRFCLRQDKADIHQEIHLVSRLREGESLSLSYPLNGDAAVAIIDGRHLYTSSRWEADSLVLLWTDPTQRERILRSVLSVSPNRTTLIFLIYTHYNQPTPDQVVVLRRLDKSGKLISTERLRAAASVTKTFLKNPGTL